MHASETGTPTCSSTPCAGSSSSCVLVGKFALYCVPACTNFSACQSFPQSCWMDRPGNHLTPLQVQSHWPDSPCVPPSLPPPKTTVQDLVDVQKILKHFKVTTDVGMVFRPVHLAEVVFGHVADHSYLKVRFSVTVVFVTTRGLAMDNVLQSTCWPVRKIERVCARSLSAEAHSMVGSSAACECALHAYIEMADVIFDPADVGKASP